MSRCAPLALLALLAGCGDAATDGSGSGGASLAVAPEYPAGLSLGGLNLVINQVKVRVVRQPAEWVVDTAIAFPAGADAVSLRVQVPLKARVEQLDVVLELWAGPLLVFAGSRKVEVSQGLGPDVPATIPLTYRGPGAEARVIQITPRDTIITPGGQLAFEVMADNGSGLRIDNVYVNWSTAGTSGASVSPHGIVTAPGTRGSAMLHARAATGARDSTLIWFSPPPTAIIPVGGGAQSGLVGRSLPTPLTVRVEASDGIGVPNIMVRFMTTDGGQLNAPTVRTDAEGVARTVAVLGTRAGPQWFQANIAGLSPALFLVEARADEAADLRIARGTDQENPPGELVAVPLQVSVTDQFGNPIGGSLIRWQVTAGGGTLGLDETHTDPAGQSYNGYRMGPAPLTNQVRATLVGTGVSVVFVLLSR